jgi:hypothetical protein
VGDAHTVRVFAELLHSGHFLQQLDLAVFGSFKRHFGNFGNPEVKAQPKSKRPCVPYACHGAAYVALIDRGGHLSAISTMLRSGG